MPDHTPEIEVQGDWAKASNRKLFELTKMLGVEQIVLARQLGVSRSAMSFWMTNQRPMPAKYRPALVVWAAEALRTARTRHQKDVQTLPTAELKVAAIEAFEARIRQWWLEVFYESGEVEASARKNLRWLRDYLDKDTWTTHDLAQMHDLWLVLGNKIDILREMAGPEDTNATQTQEGES
jgi:transcriptional regulator with XRE-family HTH domain